MSVRMNLRKRLLLQFLSMGILPLALVGGIAYYLASSALEQEAYERLTGVSQVKKEFVESYYDRIKNQITTFSEDPMVIDAAREFRAEFFKMTAERTPEDIARMKSELTKYYTDEFAVEYRKKNSDQDPQAKKLIDGLDDVGVVMQYHYIAKNANPLGSKDALDAAGDGSPYSQLHAKVHPPIRSYLQKFGYYDIFIVDIATGHIVYSVFKELDYGTSLLSGPYRDTNFAEAFRTAAASNEPDAIALVDFKTYKPSYEAAASFIASPIYDGNNKIAVALFQMPLSRIDAIVSGREGMGATGELILVGPDKLPRTDSFIDKANRSVEAAFRNPDNGRIDLPEITKALAGESSQIIADNYLGQKSLLTYMPVNVLGHKWALLGQKSLAEAFAPAQTLGYWMLGIGGFTGIAIMFFGSLIGRGIANPILRVAGELAENSRQVAGASEGLAGASGQLSELAAEQASSIEETAASIEEISAMVKNNVDQAEKSSNLSQQVKKVADQGNHSMEDLVKSMAEIMESNQKIQDLVKVIGEIGEKTSVIDEIVFQTKLLSFNASVEAERAGEHGRGFAVVAQEVGNLAQMSGKAAAEIASMVKSSIRNAEAITSENRAKVEAGNAQVQDAARYLREITDDADMLMRQADQIVNASKEQSDGVSQVNEAMGQLDQATQQNSANAEETASSSEQLASQAEQLKDNVMQLMQLVEGSADAAHLHKHQNRQQQAKGSHDTGYQHDGDSRGDGQVVAISRSAPHRAAAANPGGIKRAAGDGFAHDSGQDSWEKL